MQRRAPGACNSSGSWRVPGRKDSAIRVLLQASADDAHGACALPAQVRISRRVAQDLLRTARVESPANARLREHSYSMRLSRNIRAGVDRLASACSGDIYAQCLKRAGGCFRLPSRCCRRRGFLLQFGEPKIENLDYTRSSHHVAGLMSRCTCPRRERPPKRMRSDWSSPAPRRHSNASHEHLRQRPPGRTP